MSLASDTTALAEYTAARTRALNMQAYSEAERTYQRASLKDAEDGVDKYQKRVDGATSGGPRMIGITPKD